VNAQDTSAETEPDLQLEIAHILLIDVVGYSKLLVDEQIEFLKELNQIVRSTECFRAAETAGKLIRVPTGDGMALLFLHGPEEPMRCALEISRTLKAHPHIQVRMGVHSGPINQVTDVNDRTNIAGAGINIAQRVMDCGDAGHILLSKHLADDLAEYRHWRPHLHDLGECEVKYGLRLHLVNLYKDDLGNPHLPEKLKRGKRWKQAAVPVRPITAPRWPKFLMPVTLVAAALALVTSSLIFFHRASQTTASVSPKTRAIPTTAESAFPEKSIAVLPFENLSAEKENAYFADGVQDEILTLLAKITDLKIISRVSVMQYKSRLARNSREIGQQLGVANVVEGSVQRSGKRVRVNAKLVDARTDRQLWAQTYDRDLADVFAIQSEIAKAIAEQLQAKLLPREVSAIELPPTDDIAAFDLYARAKNLVLTASGRSTGRNDLLEAVALLNQAVARDPSFFQAYYQLASAHDYLYSLGFDRTSTRLDLANAAIQAAVRLRPEAGEIHLARAENLYRGYLDYQGALFELEVARRSLPNDARILQLMGFILRRQGRWEEATQNLEHAVELDPRNTDTLEQMAWHYLFLRRYAEVKPLLTRVLAIEPNRVDTQVFLASVDFHWKADIRPFRQMIDSVRTTNPSALPSIADAWLTCALAEHDPGAVANAMVAMGENAFGDDSVQFSRTFVEGLVARIMKDDGKARSAFTAARAEQEKVIQAQPNYGPPLCVLGLIDAALGRKEEALREGKRAVELLPVEKDAIRGPAMIKYFAMIATWAGDNHLACKQLASALRYPTSPSYGDLKLLPYWDPLRGDPRFEKIVASLAPK
jgi:serine/threonine-protein kinase